MIKPGWKRELCPQCRQPGRVGERMQATLRARKPGKKPADIFSAMGVNPETVTLVPFLMTAPQEMGFVLHVDICDNCGVMYAYEAVALPDPNPERKTESDRRVPSDILQAQAAAEELAGIKQELRNGSDIRRNISISKPVPFPPEDHGNCKLCGAEEGQNHKQNCIARRGHNLHPGA